MFRHLDYTVEPGQKLLISGRNGSGKSTLLQVLSGFLLPSEGAVTHSLNGKIIESDKLKNYISLASPYLQLTEELTPLELLQHSSEYKPFREGLNVAQVITLSGLHEARHKLIRQFSSGMKQRLKLTMAILSDTPLLLLDEPVSNLDREAIAWYKELVTSHMEQRTVVICSNAIDDDHFFCNSELHVSDFKPRG